MYESICASIYLIIKRERTMSVQIQDTFYQVFWLAVQLAGPILLVSMAVGILISILQAATQINEQTLTFVPKLLVIGIILVLMGENMLLTLQELLSDIFELIVNGF